jgi:SPP1 gp7 family putative phage head morphogenesis protein
MNYWGERLANSQKRLTSKNIAAINRQMRKYYGSSMERVIRDFERTYDKLLLSVEEGKQPTPADLYKLDKYWQMQAQLRHELQRLGDRQIATLSKIFETNFFEIYYSINIEGAEAFTTIDRAAAVHMINQIWCADGKSWSQRIWDNTSKLQQALNDNLIECVVTGKKTTQLKNMLQEQFGVSYSRADALVRTEMAHIQTQAAKQRYTDYGIQEIEIWVDEDERTCPVCSKLEGLKYPVGAEVPLPAHPRCRCSVIPVV